MGKRAKKKEDEVDDDLYVEDTSHLSPKNAKSKAGGKASIEELTRANVKAEHRMFRAVAEESDNIYGNVEDEASLQELVEHGVISQAEAHKIMTKKHMHDSAVRKNSVDGSVVAIDEVVMAGADYATTAQMLDDVLEVQHSHLWGIVVWLFGLERFQTKANKERIRREHKDFKHPYPIVHRIVKSARFDCLIGAIMVVNGVLIGFQVSASEGAIEEEGITSFDIMEHVFTSVFVVEILMRLLSDGWLWLLKMENCLDLLLILLTGVLTQWILKPAGIKNQALRSLQVLRVLRLIRLVRMVRQVKMFRILWQLIQGVVDSGRTLFWTYVVMGSMLYMFAILCVYQIGRSDSFADNEVAQEYFGTLPQALVTLFQTMTLDSWAHVARPLGNSAFTTYMIYVISIAILTLILLNLVTAVVVNNAMYRAERDQELQARLKEEEKLADIVELREIFREIDEDKSGKLSKEEFDNAVAYNDSVKMKLQLLDIPTHETEELWELLDTGSGEVTIQAFSDLLRAMQGEAKAKDSFSIVQRLRRANRRIDQLHLMVEARRRHVYELQHQATGLQEDLAVVLKDASDFIKYVGTCVPKAAAPQSEAELMNQHQRWAVMAVERTILNTKQAKPTTIDELVQLQHELEQVMDYNLHKMSDERAAWLEKACQDAFRKADKHYKAAAREAEQAAQERAMKRHSQQQRSQTSLTVPSDPGQQPGEMKAPEAPW